MGSEAFFICFKVLPQHSPEQTERIHDQGRQPIFRIRFERCNLRMQLKKILLTRSFPAHLWECFEARWMIWMKSHKDKLRQSYWHVFFFSPLSHTSFYFCHSSLLCFFLSLVFFIYFHFFLFFVIFLSLLITHSVHVQFHVLQIFAQRPTENLHTCTTLVHVYCRTTDNQVKETTNPVRMFTLNYKHLNSLHTSSQCIEQFLQLKILRAEGSDSWRQPVVMKHSRSLRFDR